MLHCTECKSCLLVVKYSTLLTSDKCQENHCSGPTYSHQRFLCSSTATYIHRMLKFPLDKRKVETRKNEGWNSKRSQILTDVNHRMKYNAHSLLRPIFSRSLLRMDSTSQFSFTFFKWLLRSVGASKRIKTIKALVNSKPIRCRWCYFRRKVAKQYNWPG